MSTRDSAELVQNPTVARLAAVGIPVGMAVYSWLSLLLLVGYVARLDGVSVLNLVPLLVFGLLFWPLVVVAPWRPRVTDRVLAWTIPRRTTLAVTVVLAGVVAAQLVSGLVATALGLPFRASGMFFGASVFYREQVGGAVGRVVFRFGQWYIEFVWLYLVSGVLVALGRRVGRATERGEQ